MTEDVYYWNYRITRREDSPLGLKGTIFIEIGFHCPRCDEKLPSLKRGSTICPECNLYMKRGGDMLFCSEKPAEKKEEEPKEEKGQKKGQKKKNPLLVFAMGLAIFALDSVFLIWWASRGEVLPTLFMLAVVILIWMRLWAWRKG